MMMTEFLFDENGFPPGAGKGRWEVTREKIYDRTGRVIGEMEDDAWRIVRAAFDAIDLSVDRDWNLKIRIADKEAIQKAMKLLDLE
jgi:hypothetical protein